MPVGTQHSTPGARTRGRRLAGAALPTRLPAAVRAPPSVLRTPSLISVLSARLSPHEWRRRAVHMSPGLLPFLFFVIPHADPLSWLVRGLALAVPLMIAALALKTERLFARRGDRGWMTSVVSYAVVTVTLLLAFPAQPELGLTVTMILAFGDGSATLAGMLLRGRRLPWNSAKSWIGLSAFLTCSIPLGTLVYWGVSRPGVPFETALACVVPAVLAAALAESLPTRLNDNIRVGVTGGLTIVATHAMFVGY